MELKGSKMAAGSQCSGNASLNETTRRQKRVFAVDPVEAETLCDNETKDLE